METILGANAASVSCSSPDDRKVTWPEPLHPVKSEKKHKSRNDVELGMQTNCREAAPARDMEEGGLCLVFLFCTLF